MITIVRDLLTLIIKGGNTIMPIYDYKCMHCEGVFEVLMFGTKKDPKLKKCPHCHEYAPLDNQVPGAPSFKIKGMRAANGYGVKSVDTYGVNKVDGRETGYSFTSNKGETTDHNQGQKRKV